MRNSRSYFYRRELSELMNKARSTIITIFAVDAGVSDIDAVDIVRCSEVDRPPRKRLVRLRARVCVDEAVNSQACLTLCRDLNCGFVRRQAVCNTYIAKIVGFRSDCEVVLPQTDIKTFYNGTPVKF